MNGHLYFLVHKTIPGTSLVHIYCDIVDNPSMLTSCEGMVGYGMTNDDSVVWCIKIHVIK